MLQNRLLPACLLPLLLPFMGGCDAGSSSAPSGTGGALSGVGGAAVAAVAGAAGSMTLGTAGGGAGGLPAVGGAPTAGSGGAGTAGAATAGAFGSGGSAVAGASGSAGSAGAGGAAGGGATAGTSGFGLAGPSRCATAGVALCEDFENGLNASIWTTTQAGDGTVVVDALHAARGTKALHVKTTAGNGHAYITEKMSFPATNNLLYGRMFVWLGDALTSDGHFSLAQGDGIGNAAAIRFGGQNKVFGVGTDGGSSGDWTDKDNKPVPMQTWICAEFEFKGDSNEFHVSWDDVERTALNRGVVQHPTFAMPQFNSLWFGYWMYNMMEPQELWIDEIAVDFKPIGCTK